MPPKSNPAPAKTGQDICALIDLTKSSRDLVTHFQSSLTPSSLAKSVSTNATPAADLLSSPLEILTATTTLLRSYTTTLSLLLLTPPLTPSALISKIGDVTSGALSHMVAVAAATTSSLAPGTRDVLGEVMRAEIRAQVRRVLGTWDDLLLVVLQVAERRVGVAGSEREGPSESEKNDVLAATGVLWEACDGLLKVCSDGVVGLVVKKAEEYRSVLMDAVEELKEWGEDVEEDEDEEDKAEGSDGEDGGLGDEDDIFGAANKLGKGDKELKVLLDSSVKRLKMVSMLYQALIKRRLKSFPKSATPIEATTNGETTEAPRIPMDQLNQLMALLKMIPDTVDDLASAFYDLDDDEAKETLDKCCGEAKSAIALVKQNWVGEEDEFTAWSEKWMAKLETC